EGKKVDNATITNVASYFALYMLCIAVILLLLCLEPFDLETNISAAVSCFNNIGPGFSSVGPMSSYAEYSDFAKLVLSCAMLLGRLEIYPMLLMFSPTVWRNRIVRS
ncbi:MAG: potassium transporter TrkG, partial [Acutalibacteraceae bacterium]|nr:potassium transporter TrkG [Acutalibacteraceae bacterium]